MHALSIPTTKFRDGSVIPLIGLGTYGLLGPQGADSVAAGLKQGYRLIDTAAQYNNETAIGEGIRRSGVDRDEVLVTTKVSGGSQGREASRRGVVESLHRLGLEYCDLVLIHWPNPSRGLALETWETLVELRSEGLIRHAGVSNFRPEQLTQLHDATGEWPEINQIQLSPGLQRHEAVAFHAEHQILTQAWSPLGFKQGVPNQIVVKRIARKHGVEPAQVSLRWAIDLGIIVIPKSANPERQRSNAALNSLQLDAQDRTLLATLDLGEEEAADSRVREEW